MELINIHITFFGMQFESASDGLVFLKPKGGGVTSSGLVLGLKPTCSHPWTGYLKPLNHSWHFTTDVFVMGVL